MKTYDVTLGNIEGIRLQFYDSGLLASFTLPEVDLSTGQIEWLATHAPIHIGVLNYWKTEAKVCRINEILPAVEFEDFWTLYNKKVGSKAEAEQYWDGFKRTITKRNLTAIDRQDIIRILPKFLARFPANQKHFQPLATTFLHRREWEAELEVMLEKASPRVDVQQLIDKWKVK